MRLFAPVAAMGLATLAVVAPASAYAGGTPAPLRSGGAAFGSPLPKPDANPIARRLLPSPREITAGDAAPAIRVRVRQRGVARVRARVVVLRLPRNRPVARIALGWLRTDR